MENSNNTGKVVGALLIGAAIGGALGILFAPGKGSKTRKKIIDQGEGVADVLKEKFNELLAVAEKAKGKVNEFVYDGKSKT